MMKMELSYSWVCLSCQNQTRFLKERESSGCRTGLVGNLTVTPDQKQSQKVCAAPFTISITNIQFEAASSHSNLSLSSEGLSDAVTPTTKTASEKPNSKRKATLLVESDSEGGSKDLDSDPGTFDIKYEITLGKKARVDCVLDNSTTFANFRQRIASEMGIPLQQLSALGYIASFWPRSPRPVPKLVDTDVRYENMIEMLEDYMRVEYTKDHKPKKKKAFTVSLIDTGANSDGKNEKKAKVSLMTAYIRTF